MAVAKVSDDRIVSGSHDMTVRIWEIASGRTLATLEGHEGAVRTVAVLPDGRIVSGSDDSTVRVWDVESRQALITLAGHQDPVVAVAILPGGRVVSGSDDKTVHVWDVESGQILATVYGDASFCSVAVINQHLIVAGDAVGNVWFIDLPELTTPR